MESYAKPVEIIILSDEKKGHLNQSLAVALMTKRPNSQVISVHYRHKILRHLLALLIHFPLLKAYCRFLVRFALTTKSAETLLHTPSKIVISTGSSLSAVNLAVCCIHHSKSIVIMKPPLGRQKSYDLRIIPKHDHPDLHKNTVITVGAPTLISKLNLTEHGAALAKHLNLPDQKTMSLFIGGNSRSHKFTPKQAEDLQRHVRNICERNDFQLLVTTSRRTPKSIDDMLKIRLGEHPQCKLFYSYHTPPNTKLPDNLIASMMGLSKLILVTEDSVSMVSEAASSGRKVIVIEMDRIRKAETKHQEMIQSLVRGGYVSLCRSRVLDQGVLSILNDPTPPKILQDSRVIEQALQQLL